MYHSSSILNPNLQDLCSQHTHIARWFHRPRILGLDRIVNLYDQSVAKSGKVLTLIEITRMNQLVREYRADRLGQDIHPLILNISSIQLTESRRLIDTSVIPVTQHNNILALGFVRSSLDNIAGTLIRSRRRVISHVCIPSILVSVHACGNLL
jgi:hypothetical protein